jgi:hypothetical protein
MKYKPFSLWSHCHSFSQSNLPFSTQRKSTSHTIHFHQFPQTDERVLSSESLWRCNSLAIYAHLGDCEHRYKQKHKYNNPVAVSWPSNCSPFSLPRHKGFVGLGVGLDYWSNWPEDDSSRSFQGKQSSICRAGRCFRITRFVDSV